MEEGIYMTAQEALIKFSIVFFMGVLLSSFVFAMYHINRKREKNNG